ncbi:MAG TPA: hypothetical protein VLJ60_08790 [bacterium]|nr:hypothetical protein [bacterium]
MVSMTERLRETGREEGKLEEKNIVCKKAILAGISNELIVTITSLTLETVAAMQKELKKKKPVY